MKKLGLALSGGGVRGVFHIGVLKAIEDAGITPAVLSGSSAGAMIGAFYASGMAPEEILKLAHDSGWFKIVKPAIPVKGFMTMQYLRDLLGKHILDDSFEALRFPLYVAVSNLNTGEVELVNRGKLIDWVVASASVPLMFEPRKFDDQLFIDGGLLMNLPASPIREKCDVLLGVNLVPKVPLKTKELSGMVRIATRCFDIAIISNMKTEMDLCDFIIQPEELHDIPMFDFSFSKGQLLYDLGYRETEKLLPEIRKAIG